MFYDIEKTAERIRQLRTQNGYTQEELAGKLNMDRSVLSRIEVGKYACSVNLLAQVSSFFNVSLDYIIFGKVQDRDIAQLKLSIAKLIRQLEYFQESI